MYFSVDLPSNGSWVTRYKQQSSKPGPYSWCNERTTRSCTLSWTWWILCKCKLTFPRLVCFIPSLSFLPYLFEELGIAKSSAYVNTWFHLSVHSASSLVYELICISILFYFLSFDFCRFCVVICFFHPRHNGPWPPTSKDFLSQIFPILILEKEPVFPF